MSETANSSSIARETLRLLATRRVSPTPDNYRLHYQEIAGQPIGDPMPEAERMLHQLAADLRTQTGGVRVAGALDKAALERNWCRYRIALLDQLGAGAGKSPAASDWARLILELLKQLETRHRGLTTARKRDSLERVLGVPASDGASLAERLQNLVKSWSHTAPDQDGELVVAEIASAQTSGDDGAARAAPAALSAIPADTKDAPAQLRDLLAQTLEFAVVSQLRHAPDLADVAGSLAKATRAAVATDALAQLATDLRQFWFKLELRGGENAELHQGLLRLLRLLIDNTQELLGEDQWLHGQVAVLQQIVTGPLDLTAISDAETRLKDVIVKQGTLRSSLQEAKAALKQLVTSFIERMGNLSDSTGDYHSRLESHARKLRQTDDIKQLNAVLAELLEDTRSAQLVAARTRDELLAARRQVEVAEGKVRELETELDKVSGLVQEDQLTGVLNRRGLDDAYEREAARAERTGAPLCVGLLDIDNFKRLNDTYGHQAGDDALQHLVRVIERTMRPSDVLARYGGEEFMLLLPETQQDEAIAVMVRLQRNLTKAFFLHDNERVLITFSAGVALRRQAENRVDLVGRADKALYQAKRSGKNRVCAA